MVKDGWNLFKIAQQFNLMVVLQCYQCYPLIDAHKNLDQKWMFHRPFERLAGFDLDGESIIAVPFPCKSSLKSVRYPKDPWEWYIYLHWQKEQQPNVGRYNIHGSQLGMKSRYILIFHLDVSRLYTLRCTCLKIRIPPKTAAFLR